MIDDNCKTKQAIDKSIEILEIGMGFNKAKELQDSHKNDPIIKELTEKMLNHYRNKYQKVRAEINAILQGRGKSNV